MKKKVDTSTWTDKEIERGYAVRKRNGFPIYIYADGEISTGAPRGTIQPDKVYDEDLTNNKKSRYSVKYGEDEKEFRTYKDALTFAKENPRSEKIYEHNKDGSNFEKLDVQRDLINKGKLNITAERALDNIKSSFDDEGIILEFDLQDYLENGGNEKEIEKIAGKNWKRKIER